VPVSNTIGKTFLNIAESSVTTLPFRPKDHQTPSLRTRNKVY